MTTNVPILVGIAHLMRDKKVIVVFEKDVEVVISIPEIEVEHFIIPLEVRENIFVNVLLV